MLALHFGILLKASERDAVVRYPYPGARTALALFVRALCHEGLHLYISIQAVRMAYVAILASTATEMLRRSYGFSGLPGYARSGSEVD
jgi:hypothetical protein